MKAGEAQVGQRVRTIRDFQAWPEIAIGSMATVRAVTTRFPKAQADAILIHIDNWPDDGDIECQSLDVELVEASRLESK